MKQSYKKRISRLGVANIEEKIKKDHLRRFGYMQRQSISKPVRKMESWRSEDIKTARKTENDSEDRSGKCYEGSTYKLRWQKIRMKQPLQIGLCSQP